MTTFISVDIEAGGPTPDYNLCSLGACEVENISNAFYAELRPITDNYIPKALEVGGFTWDPSGVDFHSVQRGRSPKLSMYDFLNWLKQFEKPVMVGFNAAFDWQFVNYYFHKFCSENPLGINCVDIKSYYMGKFGVEWRQTTKRSIPKKFHGNLPHTHNALDDAKEQAILYSNLMKAPTPGFYETTITKQGTGVITPQDSIDPFQPGVV